MTQAEIKKAFIAAAVVSAAITAAVFLYTVALEMYNSPKLAAWQERLRGTRENL
jgi:hypothetical protein